MLVGNQQLFVCQLSINLEILGCVVTVVLDEKSGDRQSHLDSSCGYHECQTTPHILDIALCFI